MNRFADFLLCVCLVAIVLFTGICGYCLVAAICRQVPPPSVVQYLPRPQSIDHHHTWRVDLSISLPRLKLVEELPTPKPTPVWKSIVVKPKPPAVHQAPPPPPVMQYSPPSCVCVPVVTTCNRWIWRGRRWR